MKIPSLLLTISTLALAAAPALADTYSFSGNTTGGPTFNRPTDAGDALSDIGTAVPYYAQPFTVSLSGSYNLTLAANPPASYDTFLHLYSGSFNPSSPLINFFAANDDAPGGGEFGSALTGVSLTSGTTYVFVADGWGNSDFGAFDASITGPGSISAVPEPTSFALVGLGAVAALIVRRQQRARC